MVPDGMRETHTPQPPAPPAADEIAALSGLEILTAMLDGRLPPPPIADAMGFHVAEVGEGRVMFRGTPAQTMTNPMGTVHGGWYGTLLDSAMACSVLSRVPKGASYTTLEYKVNIIRPIPLGTEIEAVGVAQHAGRSTGVAMGEIRGRDDQRLYATGSTTCIVFSPRP